MIKRRKIDKKNILIQVLIVGFILAFCIVYLLLGIKPVLVISNSMARYAPQGSIVLIRKSNIYKIGDVATFKFKNVPGNLITHRINSVKEVGNTKLFYTKGDNNSFSDPIPISENEIIGKVFLVIPYVGKIVSLIFIPWILYILYYIPAGFCLGNLLKSLNR